MVTVVLAVVLGRGCGGSDCPADKQTPKGVRRLEDLTERVSLLGRTWSPERSLFRIRVAVLHVVAGLGSCRWLRWKSCVLGLGNVGVVAFYYPDRAEAWDRLCQAEFLGNFYPLTEELCLEAPLRRGETHCFGNAEAAYQALKFWPRAAEFRNLSGSEAFEKKRGLEAEGQADWTYGGFGSNMAGMFQVLRVKFAPGTAMHAHLQQTGDAYLLEHNSKCGRDRFWSDNKDGDGLNWLGLQLMLLREEPRQTKPWTTWIQKHVDVETGDVDEVWQSTVRAAAKCLNQTMGPWQTRLLLRD